MGVFKGQAHQFNFRTQKSPSLCQVEWKKANVSPVFKKNDRQDDYKYRPISLLSCIAKLLERIVFMKLYEYCLRNNVLTWQNSGYKIADSTINELLYISHSTYEALEKGQDICLYH